MARKMENLMALLKVCYWAGLRVGWNDEETVPRLDLLKGFVTAIRLVSHSPKDWARLMEELRGQHWGCRTGLLMGRRSAKVKEGQTEAQKVVVTARHLVSQSAKGWARLMEELRGQHWGCRTGLLMGRRSAKMTGALMAVQMELERERTMAVDLVQLKVIRMACY
jgi:hypothetical protein